MSVAAVPDVAAPPVVSAPQPDTVDDLIAELGLEPEGAAPAPVGDKKKDEPVVADPAAPAAKTDDKDAAEDAPDKDAAADEDPDEKIIRGILARSRAARREREARVAASKTPAPAQAAPAKKPEAAPAAAAPAPSAEVRDAVRDVLTQLDKLAADDQPAPGTTQTQADAASAKRGEEMAALREKIDGIAKVLEKGDPELRERVETLSNALESMESQRRGRLIVTAAVDAIESDLPKLHDPAVLRTIKRDDGTRYRDPAEVVHDAAIKFYQKYKTAPNLKLLARRIEKNLPGASPEKTDTSSAGNGTEKPPQSRKTVSRNHGSPPAARTGPDARTKTEAEKDFYDALGIDDPHG